MLGTVAEAEAHVPQEGGPHHDAGCTEADAQEGEAAQEGVLPQGRAVEEAVGP